VVAEREAVDAEAAERGRVDGLCPGHDVARERLADRALLDH